MRPGVVAEHEAVAQRPLEQRALARDLLADEEERRRHVLALEHVVELRRQRERAVVEGQRDDLLAARPVGPVRGAAGRAAHDLLLGHGGRDGGVRSLVGRPVVGGDHLPLEVGARLQPDLRGVEARLQRAVVGPVHGGGDRRGRARRDQHRPPPDRLHADLVHAGAGQLQAQRAPASCDQVGRVPLPAVCDGELEVRALRGRRRSRSRPAARWRRPWGRTAPRPRARRPRARARRRAPARAYPPDVPPVAAGPGAGTAPPCGDVGWGWAGVVGATWAPGGAPFGARLPGGTT